MTKKDFVDKITEVYRKKSPGLCQISGEKLTPENTSDGLHGYEIMIEHPEYPGRTIKIEVCKKVYLDFYKVAYPGSDTPQI